MQSNKNNDNGWVLCPSKSLPGKYYYFNVVSGEAVWSPSDAKAPIKKGIQNVAKISHNFPEPEPVKNNENKNTETNSQEIINNITVNKHANKPLFDEISFPNYTQNVTPGTSKDYNNSSIFMTNKNNNLQLFGQVTPKVVWTQIPLVVLEPNSAQKLDQVTQTCELEKIFVHSCDIPLSKRFINYENPKISFTNDNKHMTNDIHPSTPLKPNPIFDQTKPTIEQNIIKRPLIRKPVLDLKNLKISDTNTSNTSTSNLFLQNQVENTVLKSNNKTSLSDLNLQAKDKGEAPKVQEDETKLVKLDRNDLRLFLMARKRRHTEGETTAASSETKKIKLKYADDHADLWTPKKRVTFATDTPKMADTLKDSTEGSLTIQTLKNLAQPNCRRDVWYIVVDMKVLLENYEFLNNFVLSEEGCRLVVAASVRRGVQAACAGAGAGRTRVPGARQVARALRTPPAHLLLTDNMPEPKSMEFYNDTNEAITDDILNCCLQAMKQKYHVVLLSNDEDLLKKASVLHIHAVKFDKIKDTPYQLNNICGLNANKTKLFLSPKFQSSRSYRIFENIPGLLGEIKPKPSNQKSVFDDDSITSEMTTELNRVIQDLKAQNRVSNSNEYPLHFQKPGLKSFGNQTANANNISSNTNLFENKVTNDKAELPNSNGNMNAVDIPNSNTNIDKDSKELKKVEMSVENNLRMFYITYIVMEDKIKDRMEELMCIFIQIMEDALCYVLQNSSFQDDFILPWSLQEMIEQVRLLYGDRIMLNVIVDKLLACMSQCMTDRGKITPGTKPHVFIRTIGCGVLLIECLKNILPNYEELANAKQSLMNLLWTIKNPIEIEFDNTPKASHSNADEEKRQNFTKQPTDIITYLKRHFKDWRSYEDCTYQEPKNCTLTSQENPKVFRISGKNVNMVKIDSKNTMTISNCPNGGESKTIEGIANNTSMNEENKANANNKELLESNKKEFATMTNYNFDEKSVVIKSNINTLKQDKSLVNNLNQSFNYNFDAVKSEPKVTRRLGVIKEYEEKFIRKSLDMDALDYSDITTTIGNIKNENTQNYLSANTQENVSKTSVFGLSYSGNIHYGKNDSGYNNSLNNDIMTNLIIADTDSGVNKDDNAVEKDFISISDTLTSRCEILTKPTVKNNPKVYKNILTKTQHSSYYSGMNKIHTVNEKDHISISDISIIDVTNNTTKVITNTKVDDSGKNKSDYIKRKDYHDASDTTSDSGIGSESQMTYSLVKVFLSKLSYTFSTAHDFMIENLNVLREEQLADDAKSHLHEKVNRILRHMGDIINELKSIIERESNEKVALHTLLTKVDEAAHDKRITRYRSVIRKCLEQAQHLHNALKIMHSVTEADWDGSLSVHAESISSSIRYLNIFE